jgi:hypothetical protein
MPFLGIGLHVLVALFFAVHAYRTGQNMYWLFILLAFPLLGSVIYFIVVYLPGMRLEHSAQKVMDVATQVLDPTKGLREAKAAFDYSPTAQNQLRLAAALLKAGFAEDAATFYRACLRGPFAEDPEIRLGAAKALFACQSFEEALSFLESIRTDNPHYRQEAVALLLAQTLASLGKTSEAQAQFEAALQQFGSFTLRAEYAIWAVSCEDWETANRLRSEITELQNHWNRHTRKINAPLVKRVAAAFENARKR